MATNAQLDAISSDVEAFVTDLTSLAAEFGGEVVSRDSTGAAVSVELRIPVDRWARAFAELRTWPEAADGERVWGQDIAAQVNEIVQALEDATGSEAEFLGEKLAFRIDRIERAVIVVRIRPPD